MQRNAAEDLWRVTLIQIPSRLGKLVYLAGLRDPNTGVYQHQGLAARCGGAEVADRAIAGSHRSEFQNWLEMTLVDQVEDCRLYWSSLLEDRRRVAEMWQRTESYRTWVPARATPAQRADFNTHMELMLEALVNATGVTVPGGAV